MITIKLQYWPTAWWQRLVLFRTDAFCASRPVVLERHLPKSWNELNPAQLRALAKTNFILKSESAKKIYLCYRFLKVPLWFFLRINSQDLLYIYNHLSAMMGNNTLSKTILSKVRVGLGCWLGPDHYGKNMSFLEFIKADNYYSAFMQSGNTEHLNHLVAVLYRPSRTDLWQESPDFKGDERIPLNEYHITDRAKQARRIHLVDRYAILLQYAGLRAYLQQRYPETFSGGKPSRFGWAGVIISLSGEKFGDDDAVASKNIHAILTHLEITLENLHKTT